MSTDDPSDKDAPITLPPHGTPRGAPSRLTPAVLARLVAATSRGLHQGACAAAAGIHRNTLYDWRNRGEDGEEPFATMLQHLENAEVVHQEKLLSLILDAANDPAQWKAAAWLLEKRYPHVYSAIVQREVANQVEGLLAAIKAKVSKATFAELRDVIVTQQRQGPGPGAPPAMMARTEPTKRGSGTGRQDA